MKRRTLTIGETEILRMVQEEYGPQNTEKEVFFSEADEAVLFVKARDGTSPIMVVLTNLPKQVIRPGARTTCVRRQGVFSLWNSKSSLIGMLSC